MVIEGCSQERTLCIGAAEELEQLGGPKEAWVFPCRIDLSFVRAANCRL